MHALLYNTVIVLNVLFGSSYRSHKLTKLCKSYITTPVIAKKIMSFEFSSMLKFLKKLLNLSVFI